MEGKAIIDICTIGYAEHHWWTVHAVTGGWLLMRSWTTSACNTFGGGEDGCFVQMSIPLCLQKVVIPISVDLDWSWWVKCSFSSVWTGKTQQMRPKTERHQRVELIHTDTAPDVKLQIHTSSLSLSLSLTFIHTTTQTGQKYTQNVHTGPKEYIHTHTHVRCHTCTSAHKLLWGMLLENWKPVNHWESLLEQPHVRC